MLRLYENTHLNTGANFTNRLKLSHLSHDARLHLKTDLSLLVKSDLGNCHSSMCPMMSAIVDSSSLPGNVGAALWQGSLYQPESVPYSCATNETMLPNGSSGSKLCSGLNSGLK